ncbi:Uncharacterised protein [Kurthia zopfii]|uniref:Uncharacterized protein n=1 Tax=Kurthia zopfii TaxID=1650 RepID=A0A8B4Q6G7_9BACL|nr:Uncharacterised protein [Kurthia zopfii]
MLFFCCLAPNAICYGILQVFGSFSSIGVQLVPLLSLSHFENSGKSGGAFTFPSNFPDLPHMNERDLLFVFCLAPVAYLLESLQKLGRKWWCAYFRFVFCSALEKNEPPPLFVFCLAPNAICYGILQVFGRKWWNFYFLFKPCSTLAYGRAFCAFRFLSSKFTLYAFSSSNSRGKVLERLLFLRIFQIFRI